MQSAIDRYKLGTEAEVCASDFMGTTFRGVIRGFIVQSAVNLCFGEAEVVHSQTSFATTQKLPHPLNVISV